MITSINTLRTWLVARATQNIKSERGANLVEYILLVAFIALIVVLAVIALKDQIDAKFNQSADCLENAPDPCTP